ncbi:DMT family transporter [Nocardia sp. NPDC101769]|uniref:DMT family transporter n=1 Tax=Nocardia sp. NPDC101769 TaxID=3364333 RepID=UPI0038161DC8
MAHLRAEYDASYAMQSLPVGTAYAIFTGIGAVGAIGLGIVVQKDPLGASRVRPLSMIIGGIVPARVVNPE